MGRHMGGSARELGKEESCYVCTHSALKAGRTTPACASHRGVVPRRSGATQVCVCCALLKCPGEERFTRRANTGG